MASCTNLCAGAHDGAAAARRGRAGSPLAELIEIDLLGSDRTDTLMRVAMVLMAGG